MQTQSRSQAADGCSTSCQLPTRRGLMESMSEYSVTPDGLVHIRAAAEHGHWNASFAGRPEISYSGNAALVAAKRLVRAVEGLDESTLRVVGQSESAMDCTGCRTSTAAI